jgi:hypothetical protein
VPAERRRLHGTWWQRQLRLELEWSELEKTNKTHRVPMALLAKFSNSIKIPGRTTSGAMLPTDVCPLPATAVNDKEEEERQQNPAREATC